VNIFIVPWDLSMEDDDDDDDKDFGALKNFDHFWKTKDFEASFKRPVIFSPPPTQIIFSVLKSNLVLAIKKTTFDRDTRSQNLEKAGNILHFLQAPPPKYQAFDEILSNLQFHLLLLQNPGSHDDLNGTTNHLELISGTTVCRFCFAQDIVEERRCQSLRQGPDFNKKTCYESFMETSLELSESSLNRLAIEMTDHGYRTLTLVQDYLLIGLNTTNGLVE